MTEICDLCICNAVGIFDITRPDARLFLCAQCAVDQEAGAPIATMAEVPSLAAAGKIPGGTLCWCGHRPRQIVAWCPKHGDSRLDRYSIFRIFHPGEAW